MISDKQIHEPLKQRIVINYDFSGLSEPEAREYIYSRLSLAGASSAVIDDSAVTAAYGSCSGSIRRLNTILSKAFLIGAQNKKTAINTEIIMAATNEISLR